MPPPPVSKTGGGGIFLIQLLAHQAGIVYNAGRKPLKLQDGKDRV